MTSPESMLLQANSDDYVRHASSAIRLADTILPRLDKESVLVLNGRLNLVGRADLGMSDRIKVAPLDFVPDPSSESQIGCFAEGFQMTEPYTVTNNEVVTDLGIKPMSTESLQAMIQQPLDLRDMIRFRDHRVRPSFWRALALYPKIFVNLTTDLSTERVPSIVWGPDIYLAYQVMSRLVSSRDPGATTGSGAPDRGYLFRRTIKLPARQLEAAS